MKRSMKRSSNSSSSSHSKKQKISNVNFIDRPTKQAHGPIPFEWKEHFSMFFAAPRGSGKSYLMVQLLKKKWLAKYDYVVIMSPSIGLNDDYEEFRGHEKVTLMSKMNPEAINQLFEKQVKCLVQAKSDKKRIRCPNTLLILDDVIDSGLVNFKGVVDKIAERGRHARFSLALAAQRLSSISRGIRINSEYAILFSPFAIGEFEQFIDQFVPRESRKDFRVKVLNLFEKPHQFVLLDNTVHDIIGKLKTSNADQIVQGFVSPII